MADGSPGVTVSRKEQLLLFSAATTFASLIPTAYAAWISNSVILRADFLRCLVEFVAILLSWLIVRQVSRSDRTRYNYGFGKLEHLSGLLVGGAMSVTSFVLVISSVRRFESPESISNGWPGFVLSVLSVGGNVAVWLYNERLCGIQSSPIIEAQRRLFKAKTGASLVVFVSLLCSLVGRDALLALYSDPVGSLLLAGFIAYSAFQLISSSMSGLVDASLDEVLQFAILKTLVEHDAEYAGFNEIRSRRSGTEVLIEIALEFDPALALEEIHRRTSTIKQSLTEKIPFARVSIVPLPLRRSGTPL